MVGGQVGARRSSCATHPCSVCLSSSPPRLDLLSESKKIPYVDSLCQGQSLTYLAGLFACGVGEKRAVNLQNTRYKYLPINTMVVTKGRRLHRMQSVFEVVQVPYHVCASLHPRKGETTGYYPSMYLQKSGVEDSPEKSPLRNKGAPPRR